MLRVQRLWETHGSEMRRLTPARRLEDSSEFITVISGLMNRVCAHLFCFVRSRRSSHTGAYVVRHVGQISTAHGRKFTVDPWSSDVLNFWFLHTHASPPTHPAPRASVRLHGRADTTVPRRVVHVPGRNAHDSTRDTGFQASVPFRCRTRVYAALSFHNCCRGRCRRARGARPRVSRLFMRPACGTFGSLIYNN